MKISITGAKVERIGKKYYIVYRNQIVTFCKYKETAMLLALDKEKLERMLRLNNSVLDDDLEME